MAEKVTVGVINYNGMETLPACLDSIIKLDHAALDVLVVDNNSTDGSREWLRAHHPGIRLLHLPENRGPAAARNAILTAAESEYVLHLDNDIVLEPDALSKLVKVMARVDRAAVCHPEIQDPGDPTVHHYNGGWVHFLCALVSRPEPGEGSRPEYEVFDTISGAALLTRRSRALAVGGFDEDFFFNWEDGDFVIRCTMAGYLCLNVPSAVVYHRHKPRGRSKVYYQVRNRWFIILKYYSWQTLFWLAPTLLSFELAQGAYLLLAGSGREYLRGNLAVLAHFPRLIKKRKAFKKIKNLKDHEWLVAGNLYIPRQIAPKGRLSDMLKIYEAMLSTYWRAVRTHCC